MTAALALHASPSIVDDELSFKLAGIRAELLDEYCQPHTYPWIIGFSGGKDSTLVAHLIFELLLSLPRSERIRPVHIVSNDTLVESPFVISHIQKVQAALRHAADAFGLPVSVAMTRPDLDHTFWVNLIGRGYPSPSRNFRWCTDRMKIQPTSRYVREQVCAAGRVVLLLGVRRDESAARAASANRYGGNRLNPHNDLVGCMVFRPIVEMTTDEVWETLAAARPPWGGTHGDLVSLYRNAGGGECPMVTQKSDVPSCGTSSSRFGCWTCTVVQKDRSLEGFIEAGFSEFGPLLRFRDWLLSIRDDPMRRSARRRDGRITHMSDGNLIPGPFTLEARREILGSVLALELQVGRQLIHPDEVERIKSIWAEDAAKTALLVAAEAIGSR